MRLFVAAWPPADVVGVLAGIHRPEWAGVRWTAPDQWHVTLRFLGEVDGGAAAGLAGRLGRLAGTGSCEAVLGPRTTPMGRSLLVVPVAGLDSLASAVAATAGFGGPEGRPFSGHLTLARARRRRAAAPAALAGGQVSGRWRVDEVTLVRSRLQRTGARYESLCRVALS